jgi:5'-nucleotidase
MNNLQIMLTNDDGIQSPGLWAAAEALDELGWVTVVAPREQASGTSRSMPSTSDGEIRQEQVSVNGKEWTVHAVGGTPAQAVLHGTLDIMPQKPDLVVSGINYGLNVGSGVTVSGTVGAALEASAAGIPSLAISLEVDRSDHFSYSTEIDFQAAAYFTQLFSKILLSKKMPDDVYVLKIEVPASATIETPWKTSRLSPFPFYEPIPSRISAELGQKGIGYDVSEIWKNSEPGTDIYDVLVDGLVAVTPLSLDLTSRVSLKDLESNLKSDI